MGLGSSLNHVFPEMLQIGNFRFRGHRTERRRSKTCAGLDLEIGHSYGVQRLICGFQTRQVAGAPHRLQAKLLYFMCDIVVFLSANQNRNSPLTRTKVFTCTLRKFCIRWYISSKTPYPVGFLEVRHVHCVVSASQITAFATAKTEGL